MCVAFVLCLKKLLSSLMLSYVAAQMLHFYATVVLNIPSSFLSLPAVPNVPHHFACGVVLPSAPQTARNPNYVLCVFCLSLFAHRMSYTIHDRCSAMFAVCVK